MIATSDRYDAEAIFFFDNGHVFKEMLYVEFEAVLDGVVGIPECRNQQHQAAYVSILGGLRVQAVVLFQIDFDENGHVLKSWNLPLRYLASQANVGPDLGEGPIKVVTANDCHDPEYHQQLWDCGKGLVEVLSAIKAAVKRNKLTLYAGGGEAHMGGHSMAAVAMNGQAWGAMSGMVPGMMPAFFAPQNVSNQNYMAANLEAVLRDQHERVRCELEASHASSLKKLADQNAALQQESEALNREKESVELQARQQIDVIVDKYKSKLRAQLNEQELSWQEKLAEKELLLHYAEEKQNQLRDEIAQLQASIESQKVEAVDDFLQEVAASNLELIVSERGLGNFAVKPREVLDYLENQTAFLAAQYGVSETNYKHWLTHFYRPVCQAGASTGCECGTPVTRIDEARRFVVGDSDMCRQHRLKQVSDCY